MYIFLWISFRHSRRQLGQLPSILTQVTLLQAQSLIVVLNSVNQQFHQAGQPPRSIDFPVTFSPAFTSIPESAFALQEFDILNTVVRPAVYSLSRTSSTSGLTYKLTADTNVQLYILTVRLMAAVRQDFEADYFVILPTQLLSSPYTFQYILTYKTVKKSTNFIVYYLVGFDLNGNTLSPKLGAFNFNPTTSQCSLTITGTAPSGSNPAFKLNKLEMTYLFYDTNNKVNGVEFGGVFRNNFTVIDNTFGTLAAALSSITANTYMFGMSYYESFLDSTSTAVYGYKIKFAITLSTTSVRNTVTGVRSLVSKVSTVVLSRNFCPAPYTYQISPHSCVSSCLNGFYSQATLNYCADCITNCQTCSNNKFCLTCKVSSATPSLVQLTGCVCNQGFFGDGATCTACHHSCKTCNAASATSCLTCLQSNIRQKLSNGECKCKGGYVDVGVAMCSGCDKSCLTCISNLNNCVICRQNRQLINGACPAMSGFFVNSKGEASGCFIKCQTCQKSETNCLSCSKQKNRTLSNGECVCMSNFYQNYRVECQPCLSNCQSEPIYSKVFLIFGLILTTAAVVMLFLNRLTGVQILLYLQTGFMLGSLASQLPPQLRLPLRELMYSFAYWPFGLTSNLQQRLNSEAQMVNLHYFNGKFQYVFNAFYAIIILATTLIFLVLTLFIDNHLSDETKLAVKSTCIKMGVVLTQPLIFFAVLFYDVPLQAMDKGQLAASIIILLAFTLFFGYTIFLYLKDYNFCQGVLQQKGNLYLPALLSYSFLSAVVFALPVRFNREKAITLIVIVLLFSVFVIYMCPYKSTLKNVRIAISQLLKAVYLGLLIGFIDYRQSKESGWILIILVIGGLGLLEFIITSLLQYNQVNRSVLVGQNQGLQNKDSGVSI